MTMSVDGPDADTMLAEVQTLKARSRRLAHGGAWLPAFVLAALALLSIVLYRYPFTDPTPAGEIVNGLLYGRYPYWAGLPGIQRDDLASYAFWLIAEPLAFVIVAWWYRQRERRHGVRVAWRVPIVAGLVGLVGLLALFAAPVGTATVGLSTVSVWQGLLTPLLSVGFATIALGIIERSVGITLSGVWMTGVAWQVCAFGAPGELFGWQAWLLGFGSGPALGGQITLLGLQRPGPTVIAMTLPLLAVATYRALRARAS
jgi:hypothetical protein